MDDRDRDFSRELEGETKGFGQQVKGKVKEETGDVLDDRSMEIEGKAEKNLGKAKRDVNNPMGSVGTDRDWSEGSDVSGEDFNKSGSISDRDRSSGTTSGSDRDRTSGTGSSDRSGNKDRSGY
jgi:uncharacterized protein YjbJ (UPF0337 family)